VIKFDRTWTWRSRCKISRQNISTHSVSQWQTEHKASHETVIIYESTLTFKHHWFRSIQPHVGIVGMCFRLPIVHSRHREQQCCIWRAKIRDKDTVRSLGDAAVGFDWSRDQLWRDTEAADRVVCIRSTCSCRNNVFCVAEHYISFSKFFTLRQNFCT